MGKLLFKVFEWAISKGLSRLIKGLSIGVLTFTALNALIQNLLTQASQKLGDIGGLGANALGLSGFDLALAIIAGAIVSAVFIKSQMRTITGVTK